MKTFLQKLYDKLTEPLYRRLSRDQSIALQTQLGANLDFQERFVQSVLDELLVLSVQLEEHARLLRAIEPDFQLGREARLTLAESGLSNEQIASLLSESRSCTSMMELAQKWGVSPLSVARLKARIGACNLSTLKEIRDLEVENARLMNVVADRAAFPADPVANSSG